MEEYIKERALYYYPKGRQHATHGIVYTVRDDAGQLIAVDTYWDSRFNKGLNNDSGRKYLVPYIADDLKFIMMIDDIKETSREEFYLYNNEDALHIPVGGWNERFLVNKNAKKNVSSVLAHIKYAIESNESEVKSHTEKVEKLKQWKYCVETNNDIAQLFTNSKYEHNVEYAIERELDRR